MPDLPKGKIVMTNMALRYPNHGWRIFPLLPRSKKPATEQGYKNATLDLEQIVQWWGEQPRYNIGLACGPSGLIALDADPFKYGEGAEALIKRLQNEFPTTTQRTPTEGIHLLYRLPEGVKLTNRSRGLPDGIDVRVNGYIVLAPSLVAYHGAEAEAKGVEDGYAARYQWVPGRDPDTLPPQPLPDFVVELLAQKAEPATLHPPAPRPANGYQPSGSARYARTAFENELDTLARTPVGRRNEQLNISAFSLGQLVAGGELDEGEVVVRLAEVAARIGLEEREIERTILSGLEAGKKEPRTAPAEPVVIFRKLSTVDAPALNGAIAEAGNGDDAPEEDPEMTGVETFSLFDVRPEDGGILKMWLKVYGREWLYVTGYERWYFWTGTHWQQDELQMLQREIQRLLEAMNEQAHQLLASAQAEDDRAQASVAKAYINATKRSRGRIESIVTMAQANRSVMAKQLNALNVLNLANGTLDLDTLKFREHTSEDLLTYCLPYDYDWYATCPRWKQFIAEVLVKEDGKTPDEELAKVVQELFGYSLTTDTQHETMAWLSGEGSNGKTVMITVLRHLLGPLAGAVDFQSIGLPGNYDLADLPGRRVIFSTEAERGGKIAEGYIKRIVSGEEIKARAIYGVPFEFKSTAKIWWAMNDKPTIKDTSNATWRRLILVPFYRVFSKTERDTHLVEKLLVELPGILNWAIEGLLRLRNQGQFTEAQAVQTAIEEFKFESNPVAQWLQECTETGGETLATAAFQNYALWCTRTNSPELTPTAFGRELTRLRIHKDKKRSGWVYRLTLKTSNNL